MKVLIVGSGGREHAIATSVAKSEKVSKIYMDKDSLIDDKVEINGVTVREAKREWLARYNFPADEIHIVKYGTTKANCTRHKADFQILVDDNEMVRNGWSLGGTINANENILENLIKLLDI